MLFTSGFDIVESGSLLSLCFSESFPIITVFSTSEVDVWNLGTERNHAFRLRLQNLIHSFLLRAVIVK